MRGWGIYTSTRVRKLPLGAGRIVTESQVFLVHPFPIAQGQLSDSSEILAFGNQTAVPGTDVGGPGPWRRGSQRVTPRGSGQLGKILAAGRGGQQGPDYGGVDRRLGHRTSCCVPEEWWKSQLSESSQFREGTGGSRESLQFRSGETSWPVVITPPTGLRLQF